jgi:hypothetical protein
VEVDGEWTFEEFENATLEIDRGEDKVIFLNI